MNKKELHKFAENVARLSNLLTRERETLPFSYLKDKDLREAYIRYYVPVNLSKIQVPLKELSLHSSGILKKERLRILDLGSGPGTAILGVMDFFSAFANKPILVFTAVDQIEENLRDAERIFRSFKADARLDATLITVTSGIWRTKSLPGGAFDIIILSNVLGEVFHPNSKRTAAVRHPEPDCHPELVSGSQMSPGHEIPKQVRDDNRAMHSGALTGGLDYRINLLKSLINRNLASDGSVIIIEPALRETSRGLLEVRDGLLKEGLHIYSPCLINNPCPALMNPKDWCHEDIPWEPPPDIREIDKLTGLRKNSLKFSYLIIRKDTLSIGDTCGSTPPFRVVSEPLISKGKIEFYLCGAGSRRLAVRLDKDETNLNEPYSKLTRGGIVSFQGLVDEGMRLRVVKETVVIPLSSTNPLTIPSPEGRDG